jgi:ferredoxin
MRKLKIEYHKAKCIGAFNCTKIAPEEFEEEDGVQANLINIKEEHGYQTKIVECDDKTAQRIIEAAEKCPANVINVIDIVTKEKVVDTTVKVKENIREIKAVYDDMKEFVLDEKGYFLIRIIPEKKMIEVGFCGKRNTVEVKVYGTKPIEIYQTILREKIIERPDHAAYLGRELQKAYIALELNIPYIQDDELDGKAMKKKEAKQ